MSTTSAPGSRRRRSRFLARRYRKSMLNWLWVVIIAILMIIVAMVVLMILPPDWYRPIHKMSDAVYNQADHAQASLMALRNNLLPANSGSITWTITQDEVNSMLAVAYGVPEKSGASAKKSQQSHRNVFTDPFIRFTGQQITLSCRDSHIPGDPVVSVGLRIDLSQKGTSIPQARITLNALGIGNIPLPPSLLTRRLKSVLPRLSPMVRKIMDVYAGPGYAQAVTPQIVDSIAAIASGKPFPTELRLNHRRLVMDKLFIHGAYTDASGHRQPAALTFELSPEP